MKTAKVFLLGLFICTSLNLYPQEFDTGESEALPPPPDEERVYVIADFEFDIKGHTRPFALVYNLELKRGEEIRGDTNFQAYISDKTQMLINQRVLKDNAELTYSIGEQDEDGRYPVTLIIKTEDSWNIIALPQPRYTSNTGFELTIKARDYNFLGTMNPLRVDLGYRYDEKGRSSFSFEIDSDTPFRAFGLNWTFLFTNLFSYRPNVEEKYYYRNITGLSLELPFEATTFTFGFEETVNFNEENSDRNKIRTEQDFQKGLYMTSRLYGSWKVPTGFLVSRYGELTYTPELSMSFNHELPNWPLQEIRYGPSVTFNNSLGFERINWHANYREGLSSSINLSYSYNFYRYQNNEEPSSVTFALNSTGHFIISSFFGISARILYRHWFYNDPPYYESAGDSLRGILDKSMHARYMLSLNMDFPFRVLVFVPSQWFDKTKLRLFDFELQASPVIDMAVYSDPDTGTSFNPKNAAFSGGLEIIVFPAFFRRLYLRASIAVNIRELLTARPFAIPGGDNREISITMGHFY